MRELLAIDARAKTAWSLVSDADIGKLLRLILDSLSRLEAKPYVLPVPEGQMGDAIKGVFPHGAKDALISDLRLQAAAMQFQIAATATLNPARTFELVVDHDYRPIKVGGRRRQATLRLRDVLLVPSREGPQSPPLTWDAGRRYSSKFPADFTYEAFWQHGYPLRPLIDSVGLQLVDAYIGLWRKLRLRGESPFGITPADFGRVHEQTIDWVQTEPSPRREATD